MESDKDDNLKTCLNETPHSDIDSKADDSLEINNQESSKEVSVDDAGFKVPNDIAFKRPIFNKLPKITKPNPIDKPTENKEEESPSIESSKETTSFEKSPAEQLVEKSVSLPYKEPSWSGLPNADYLFEVLKDGIIVETIPLNKAFMVIGRLAQCDIVLVHPSLSRFHCVIQYRAQSSDEEKQGFYAYDLSSTHGSFHNKHRMKPHVYYRLHVGHLIKLGGSSRMLILQGPDEDQEPESELTVTELKAEAAKRAEKLNHLEIGNIEEDRDRKQKEDASKDGRNPESEGIDWGMGEDAVEDEEEANGENPFAVLNEELYLNDPKKTLRGWFEREGYDLPEYVAEDVSPGVYKCKVDLPVPGPGGSPLVAIVEHRGRKKAAVIQCALEACRLLDKRGVLRQAKHESHEKKRKDWAQNDYYDSDEDDFLDRTGDVQRKRMRRMKAASGKDSIAETYDSLIAKYKGVIEELSSLEDKLAEADKMKKAAENSGTDEDDLDSYMRKLKSQVPDKHKRVNWKLRTVELRKEEMRLRRLANVAKPFDKPELQPYRSMFDTKQKSQAFSPFERQTDMAKNELLFKQRKGFGIKVNKAFLEEEPEHKVKLSRLDDENPPIKHKIVKSKPEVTKVHEENKKDVCDSIRKQNIEPFVENMNAPDRLSDRNLKLEEIKKRSEDNQEERDSGISTIHLEEPVEVAKEVSSEKKPRLLGPTLPTNLEYLKAGTQDPSKVKRKPTKKKATQDEDVAKYDTWIPPSNQTGDGRTSLNDKYGY